MNFYRSFFWAKFIDIDAIFCIEDIVAANWPIQCTCIWTNAWNRCDYSIYFAYTTIGRRSTHVVDATRSGVQKFADMTLASLFILFLMKCYNFFVEFLFILKRSQFIVVLGLSTSAKKCNSFIVHFILTYEMLEYGIYHCDKDD